MRFAVRLFFLIALVVFAPNALRAQSSVAIPSFSTATTGFQLNGSATLGGSSLQLTPATTALVGSAWYQTPLTVAGGFDTTLTFRITGTTAGTPGADGMAFVIQNSVASTSALGVNGNELGYGGTPNGIENSLAIELDVYSNTNIGDPVAGNQISVHTNGIGINDSNETYSIGAIAATTTLGNGQTHTLRVTYVPGTLTIYLNNLTTPLLTIPYDIINGGNWVSPSAPVGGLSLLNYDAYVGFTGATGGVAESHEVLSWTWTSTGVPDASFQSTVGVGVGGPYDVLTVNSSTGGIARVVNATVTQPLTIQMALPPIYVNPAPFVIWGFVGAAAAQDQFPTPYGTLCINPQVVGPGLPWLFTIADSIGTGPQPILPATPAPWGWVIPTGLFTPTTFTIQGMMLQPNGGGQYLPATTNGIIVNVNAAPAPSITTINPNSATPGSNITVTGTNFLQGAVVIVGGQTLQPTSITPTTIVFTMPVGIPCGSSVIVINPDFQSATRAFNPTPTISSTPLSTGTHNGGATYVIVGTGFAPGMIVTIGGNPMNITSQSATSIVGTTPPGPIGPAQVVVTTPGGCSVTTNYTYN